MHASGNANVEILGANMVAPGVLNHNAVMIEMITTFMLVFTVLASVFPKSDDKEVCLKIILCECCFFSVFFQSRTPYAAIPIGFAVTVGILCSGKISGDESLTGWFHANLSHPRFQVAP